MEFPRMELLWEYPDYWAKEDPNFPYIRFGKKTIITAKNLKYKSDQLAKAFLSMGVKKGDTIVTIIPTTPEFIITFLAASKIGAITIPMDKVYKKADFRQFIPHSDPKIIVSINKWQKNRIGDDLQELSSEFGEIQYIMIGEHELGISFEDLIIKKYDLEEELNDIKENQNEEDCTLVIWTGGTTGVPKAVELTHKNIIEMCLFEYNLFIDFYKSNKLLEEDLAGFKSLVNLPVSHVGGTVELLCTSLISGFQIILQASWSPWDSLKAVKEHNLKFMGGVPTMFKIFLSLPDLDTYEPKRYLKLVILSGERVSLDLLNGIKERICNNIIIGYGSTEAGSEVTFTKPGEDFKKIAEGYVGKALPKMNIIIADDKGNKLPPYQTGEVQVKGPLTSKSYFRMPEQNKTGFTSKGYCKTGDLGFLDEEGGLYITGRIKEIIRVGAFTVLPNEIEELVLQHPKVAIAAAIGAPDDIKGEVVWLVIGPELGQKFDETDEAEILKMCRKNLAKFKVPQKIIIYPLNPNDLPITRIGKVDKVRLKKELLPTFK